MLQGKRVTAAAANAGAGVGQQARWPAALHRILFVGWWNRAGGRSDVEGAT